LNILRQTLYSLACAALLAACATPPVPPASKGHLTAEAQTPPADTIPAPVTRSPYLPPPSTTASAETYTVVVNEVPVKELLFALARDAKINIDVHPAISGVVTVNAVDQTLEQILTRLSRQVDMRYRVEDDNLLVSPDTPYLHTYVVDYVNMSRDTTGQMTISTQIFNESAGGGGPGAGDNNTSTDVTNTSNNQFWQTLNENILAILEQQATGQGASQSASVIINSETGLITVRATSRQHGQIREFIDTVVNSAQRQVLIEATIVEVTLDDDYKTGIDWESLGKHAGFTFIQSLSPVSTTAASFIAKYNNPDSPLAGIEATLKALREYGDIKVLSSPKIMTLNNQTALLKVVDNEIYFDIEVDTVQNQTGSLTTFDTTAHTIPVGFIMNVTPQISGNDAVILNVRPTISRRIGEVVDPNPDLKTAGVISEIPIIRVREMESVLRVSSGQTAILGGLMQDTVEQGSTEVPLLSSFGAVGDMLFRGHDQVIAKNELVIFLRPTVIRNASIDRDLSDFRQFLPAGSAQQ